MVHLLGYEGTIILAPNTANSLATAKCLTSKPTLMQYTRTAFAKLRKQAQGIPYVGFKLFAITNTIHAPITSRKRY